LEEQNNLHSEDEKTETEIGVEAERNDERSTRSNQYVDHSGEERRGEETRVLKPYGG
jgi:hypothetical protein